MGDGRGRLSPGRRAGDGGDGKGNKLLMKKLAWNCIVFWGESLGGERREGKGKVVIFLPPLLLPTDGKTVCFEI